MDESWEYLLPRSLVRLGNLLRDIAGCALILMMSITVFDIVARGIGFGSIEWVIEASSLSVLIIVFFGLAGCTAAGGHILIDLFTRNNKTSTNRLIDGFWLMVMAAMLVLIAWYSLDDALITHGTGERTEVLHLSPLVIIIPSVGGMVVTALVALWIGIRAYTQKPD
ncbi:MAG: TRAP transporter small permease [Proteobacteria bacterium]|nr:TRAP transporter small permease [Pseudomonadota bacterium]